MANFTLGSLAAHFIAAQAHMKAAEKHALGQAAKLIEKTAKDEIGSYQGEASPFVAWAELADGTKDDRVKQGFAENEPGLRTGEMRDSISHVVGDGEAVIGSDDEKLEWFELGTVKQPPRSVLGKAAVTEAPAVANLLGQSVVKTLFGQGVAGGKMPIP